MAPPQPESDDVAQRVMAELMRIAQAHGPGAALDAIGGIALAAKGRSTAPRSRRRPRQEAERTLRIRVDLKDLKPAVWRRLELGSHLRLSEVHEVLQVAFGWTDSHLYRFGLGTSVFDPDEESFRSPFDEPEFGEEDDGSIPAADIRLDEVLAESGDRLRYVYDFGDHWEHVLKVEAVSDRTPDAPPARCTGGRLTAPEEDSGGPWNAEGWTPEPIDPDEITRDLTALMARLALPPSVVSLLRLTAASAVGKELSRLTTSAVLGAPVQISPATAERMVSRFTWLIDRFADGVKLTSAGYLPPAVVTELMTELALDPDWIGAANREDLTWPVARFRESAQQLKLLRKYKGTLQVTKPALKLRKDPVGLWHHLIAAAPLGAPGSAQQQAGVALLLALIDGRSWSDDSPLNRWVATVLSASGWSTQDRRPLDATDAYRLLRDLGDFLGDLGAFAPGSSRRSGSALTPDGVLLARALLQRDG